MTNSTQYLDAAILLDVCSHLNLMFLLTDEDFMIRFASPSLETQLHHALAGRVLMDAIPALAGIDQELKNIAFHRAEPWRIRGLQLDESDQSQYDVMIMPRGDEVGLVLAAWRIEIESSVEQVLRQQRNELVLSFDRLSEQASLLRTTNDRIASLERERHALLNMIVWDIRSSVSVIVGYSEWLSTVLALPPESESQKALNIIQDSALGMTDLMEDVTVLERIEQKLSQIEWQPLSLDKLVSEVVAIWQSVATTQGVRIEVHIAHDLPEIEADIQLLQEAVQVLLKAMIDMAPAGADVLIRLFTWDRWLVVRFEQSLPGTSGERQSAQKTRTKSAMAPDLQLALARLIAEGHGGHLSVEDSESSSGRPAFSLWLSQKTKQSDTKKDVSTDASPPISNWLVAGRGNIRINTTSQQVWVGRKSVSLTISEYRLLLHLAEHVDQVVSHEQLSQAVWPDGDSDSIDKLRVLVWRLRQKLGCTEAKSYSIRTVRGFGYMIVS
ncbi:MAG TPA: hypothetical protein G4N94_13925 [Caldilineae bacterium]|nr:hypothetical protein [Caldilineae bacterium]